MTVIERIRVDKILELQRREVIIDPIKNYRLIGIYSFGKGIFHRDPAIGSGLGDYRFFKVNPGDLVLSNIQAWEGAIGYATATDAGTVGTHRFLSYVPISNRIDTNWARWFFLSEPGMELIRRAAPGTSMRNRTLSISRFEALEIPLPPIDDQLRLAERLDRSREKVQFILQKSVVRRSTGGSIVTGWLDNAINQFGARRTLGDIADVVRGRGPSYAVDTGLFAINQACIRWGKLDLTRSREVAKDWWCAVPEAGRIRVNDVLVNSTGEGTIGRAALADESAAATPFDSHVLVVRCNKDILLPAYLAVYLRSSDGQRQVEQAKGANTTKQTELGKTKLERFQIPVPSPEEQELLVTRFHSVNTRMLLLEERMAEQEIRLSAVIPSMLNEAFGGLSY